MKSLFAMDNEALVFIYHPNTDPDMALKIMTKEHSVSEIKF